MSQTDEYKVYLPRPHAHQARFIYHPAKRKIVKAGRRGGKTVGVGIYAVEKFLEKRRVLYAAPTTDQIARFWVTVCRALREPIEKKRLYKNETEHIIEIPGTEIRIRAKTAWNADTLRGDYADVLIMDEWQLMGEDTWDVVGAPMLLDNNGDAIFIYTPPSLRSRSVSKANDPQHAAKLFQKYKAHEDAGNTRFATFHFRSMDNPHISNVALSEITQDMTSLAYRMEILAEDIDEAPGALWTRETIEKSRVVSFPDLDRIVVAVDPSTTSEGDEAGIIGIGVHRIKNEAYVLADKTIQGSPLVWAKEAVALYHSLQADTIVAESNQGGEMVKMVLNQVDDRVPVKLVHASRGKQTRADPISAQYEQGRVHHVGSFPVLEDEMCMWMPGDPSPNRMDALVWGVTELMLSGLLAFPEFRLETHGIDPVWPIPNNYPIYQTFVWGYDKPFAVNWFYVDNDERGIMFAEWYGASAPSQGGRLLDSEIAEGIIEREKTLGIDGRQIFRIASQDCFAKKPDYKGEGHGPSTSEIFSQYRIFISPGDQSRELKIRQFRERLRIDKPEGSMLRIYKTCSDCFRTIGSLLLDKTNPEIVDTNGDDAIYNSIASFCMARPIGPAMERKDKTHAEMIIGRVETVHNDWDSGLAGYSFGKDVDHPTDDGEGLMGYA